jgi:hypothetical protein
MNCLQQQPLPETADFGFSHGGGVCFPGVYAATDTIGGKF